MDFRRFIYNSVIRDYKGQLEINVPVHTVEMEAE